MESIRSLSETVSQVFQPLTPEILFYPHVARGEDSPASFDGGLLSWADHLDKSFANTDLMEL